MEMTIDKAIEFYNGLECYTPQAKDARDVAIDTMRKYQKMQADTVSTLRDIKQDIEDAYERVALEADILSGDLGVFATMVDCIMDKHIKRISEGENGNDD